MALCFNDLFNRLYNSFIENVEHIFLLYPIPELGYYPLEPHLYGYYEMDEEITYDYEYWKEYSLEINNYLDSLPETKITKIYSHKYFCDSFIINSCTFSYGVAWYHACRLGWQAIRDAADIHGG